MRLIGIDLARYAAFVGMVLVNFRIAADVKGGQNIEALLTTALEGRAAALFVVLAGVGLSLGRPNWHLTLRRALFLFAIGMLNMTIFEADILHFYALYFIAAIPFLTASRTTLLAAAVGSVAIGLSLHLWLAYDTGWNWDTLAYADFWSISGFLRHSLFNGWHPVLPWVGFVFWGMWLGRLDLSLPATQTRLLLWGVLVALLAQITSGFLAPLPEIGELLTTAPIPPGPLYMIAAGASATAFLALILIVMRNATVARLATPLVTAGRHTLSHYAGHILIGMGTLEAMGLLGGVLSSKQIFVISLAYCFFAALFSAIWSRMLRRGPLEALMRLTTEGKT